MPLLAYVGQQHNESLIRSRQQKRDRRVVMGLAVVASAAVAVVAAPMAPAVAHIMPNHNETLVTRSGAPLLAIITYNHNETVLRRVPGPLA